MSEHTALARDWLVGVDVGGTFTDIIAVNRASGETRDGKVLSTSPQDIGVLESISSIGVAVGEIDELVHGHTVGINAVLSRKGAKTALLCTSGHRDLLDIGRMNREFGESLYDPTWLRPHQDHPIVDRELRIPMLERMGADGRALLEIEQDDLGSAVRILKELHVESVGVCFLNSYANAAHEEAAVKFLSDELPGVYLQSSSLYPVTKEHERTTTVALDAYVGPAVSGYLRRLETSLDELGFDGSLWIMMMNGGVGTLSEALRTPVFQLVSGPVGGVSAAVQLCEQSGLANLLTMDVGGTSTDVAVISGGQTPLTDLWEVEHGLTLTMPLVDVGSVGSGAGSIISTDVLGSLRVGPASAGSEPGPACYGLGGTSPALTDACTALGILQPDLFANGALHLDVSAATTALAKVGSGLGLDTIELATAAYELACQDVAAKIRSISVYRGVDVRQFALLSFGAAGPMLANRVGEIMGVGQVIVPPSPGQFSALGLLGSDLRVTRGRSPMALLTAGLADTLESLFVELQDEISKDLASQGVDVAALRFERAYFAMYAGQTWDNRMPIGTDPVSADAVEVMTSEFHQYYSDSYGFSAAELSVMLTSVEVTAIYERVNKLGAAVVDHDGDSLVRTSTVHMPGAGAVETAVHRREWMSPGDVVQGPALIVEKYATTVVLPEHNLRLSADNLLTITSQRNGGSPS